MKKIICAILSLCMLAAFLPLTAGADELDPERYAHDEWYVGVKGKAFEADHVIGPGGDVLNSRYEQVHYWCIIMPGETIAILPNTSHPGFGIQGGHISSWYGNTIYQMDDPVVVTDYLTHGSVPAKTELTPLATETMTVPFGDRVVDKPDSPVASSDGISSIEYVSLYRNDTGLPIIFDGGRDGAFNKTVDHSIVGMDSSGYTVFQGGITVKSSPTLIFAEPYYTLSLGKGYFEYQVGGGYDIEAPLPKGTHFPDRLYVTNKDVTYEMPIPEAERFSLAAFYNRGRGIFTPNESGVKGDGVYTYVYNMQSRTRNFSQTELEDFLCDTLVAPRFYEGYTIRFYGRGGKIDGKTEKFVAAVTEYTWSRDDLTLDIGTVVPVANGANFLGWCTDPDRPTETLITDTSPEYVWENVLRQSDSRHTNLYAVWDGEPEPPANPFSDVKTDQYYAEPVLWAVAHDPQITKGVDATHFAPDDTCTRAQIVTFLWRAKGCPEPKSSENVFGDVDPGEYYYEAVLWAVENGITTGTGKSTFSPNDGCTRAQVVTFLWRSEGKPAPTVTNNPFRDVPAGEYYTDAVLWAVEKKITVGTSANTFDPAETCTRGQIVTFLYRDLA